MKSEIQSLQDYLRSDDFRSQFRSIIEQETAKTTRSLVNMQPTELAVSRIPETQMAYPPQETQMAYPPPETQTQQPMQQLMLPTQSSIDTRASHQNLGQLAPPLNPIPAPAPVPQHNLALHSPTSPFGLNPPAIVHNSSSSASVRSAVIQPTRPADMMQQGRSQVIQPARSDVMHPGRSDMIQPGRSQQQAIQPVIANPYINDGIANNGYSSSGHLSGRIGTDNQVYYDDRRMDDTRVLADNTRPNYHDDRWRTGREEYIDDGPDGYGHIYPAERHTSPRMPATPRRNNYEGRSYSADDFIERERGYYSELPDRRNGAGSSYPSEGSFEQSDRARSLSPNTHRTQQHSRREEQRTADNRTRGENSRTSSRTRTRNDNDISESPRGRGVVGGGEEQSNTLPNTSRKRRGRGRAKGGAR